MKHVLVIGAGIGGLSAAIQLAYRGYKVTVLEKNDKPGGKIIQIKKNGYVFDGGASFITLSDVYEDFFASVGKKRKDYFTWNKLKDTTTFHFADHTSFTLASDYDTVYRRIQKQFPGEEKGYEKFMKKAGRVYELLYKQPGYAKRNYNNRFGLDYLLTPRIIKDLFGLAVNQTWEALVKECFKDEKLRMIFSYQSTFVGMQPHEALATYSFLTWAEIVDGMHHVEGGVYSIVEGFYNLARELGATFHFNEEVTELVIENKTVTSVKTKSNTYSADLVVSNADGAWFYTHLIPQTLNRSYTPEKLKQMKHTNSYFTVNLGIKQPVNGVSHHAFYVGQNWRDFFKIIFQQKGALKIDETNLCYYLLQKSVLEPNSVPKGKASLFLLIPVPGYDPKFHWSKYEAQFLSKVYDVMEKRDKIPIRELIEEEIVYSPSRWGAEFNLWNNIILGFSLNLTQINNFRFPNKAKEFKNLYFVGGSTIPGPGVPTCITSGMLVAQRIEKELRKTE